MKRVFAVTRMHLVDHLTLWALPTGVLVSALAINVAVWSVVNRDGRHTGGLASIYVFLFAIAALAVVRGLPFAMSLGSSRRAFSRGTAITGALLGVAFGTLCFVLQLIEHASDGWGLGGNFFWFPWFGTSWALNWLLFAVSLIATFMVGGFAGSIVGRFQMWAVIVGGPAFILLGGGLVVLVSWQRWWGDVGSWFADLTPATTTVWCAVLAIACGTASWAVLRRYRVS